MSQENLNPDGFDHMPLSPAVLQAVCAAGYTTPTPIQEKAVPLLASGRDLIGQAKTGTGKTAAFALPLLSRIDLDLPKPQVLVLTPTRELAIQVAESFKTYGRELHGLRVLPVYGGQSYGVQLAQLKKGVHVIVGTPGRLMDHIQRKTIALGHLFCKVLDEADEMLHMGFIEDVEWIFSQVSHASQTALFSATMPGPIRKIAQTYLTDPEEITLRSQSLGVENISQKFWMVKGCKKIVGLSRILQAEAFDGVIVFVKTKSSTLEVCRELEEKGFKAEALNGDMAQEAREKTVERLKSGRIDILIATDVAARGLDVDRISHVINYDVPGQTEPYVHRIGRTGRAGRKGQALLFIQPKERWLVRKLEKATGQTIEQIQLPSNTAINKKRTTDFKAAITQALSSEDLDVFQEMATAYALENDLPVERVAAALGKLAHGDTPFLLPNKEADARTKKGKSQPLTHAGDSPKKDQGQKEPLRNEPQKKDRVKKEAAKKDQANETATDKPMKTDKKAAKRKKQKQADMAPSAPPAQDMDRYRIEVGRSHGLTPKDIVGAIANEAGLEGRYIQEIVINQDFSFVDLPKGMPKGVFRHLKRTWLRSKPMSITRVKAKAA